MKVVRRNSKAIGSGLGSGLGLVIVALLRQYTTLEIGVELEAAIILIVATAITWIAPANEYYPLGK